MGRKLGELTEEKNEAYGDSFKQAGEVLKILYPNGISPEQYKDALAVVRVIDKLFRIATRKTAFGESPWKDIAGYSILGAVSDEGETEPRRNCQPWTPKVGDEVRITDGAEKVVVTAIHHNAHPFPYRVRYNDGKEGILKLEELKPVKP